VGRNRKLIGVLALLAVIGGWVYFGFGRNVETGTTGERIPSTTELSARSSHDASAADEPRDVVDREVSPESRSPAVARDPDPSPETIPAATARSTSSSSVGRLRVRAVDAETRSPVPRIRVRAMNDTRLADRSSDRDGGPVEMALTPGTYTVLVMAKGFEESFLLPRSIEAGETANLDSVEMHAGSAKVLGTVTGDTWRPDTLWVELVGDGRSPCRACADVTSPASKPAPPHGQRWSKDDYCARCGYGKSSSRLAVPPNGRFAFDRLTRGAYIVRLMDIEERTLADPQSFDLEIGQSLPLEIRFVAPRSVRVEILDADGASLAPEWASRLRKEAAADEAEIVSFNHGIQPVEFGCEFRTEKSLIGSSTFTTPLVEPNVAIKIGPAPFGSRKLGAGAQHGRDVRDDRERQKSDNLRPEAAPPSLRPGYFPGCVDVDGFVRFDSVPSLELTLSMSCQLFTATTVIPSSRDELRLQATLIRNESVQWSPGDSEPTEIRTFREYDALRSR
jgi:hypothetical protein